MPLLFRVRDSLLVRSFERMFEAGLSGRFDVGVQMQLETSLVSQFQKLSGANWSFGVDRSLLPSLWLWFKVAKLLACPRDRCSVWNTQHLVLCC